MNILEVQEELKLIGISELCELAEKANQEFMRLVQIHATTLEGQIELNYCFATMERWLHLRLTVNPGQEVPSISKTYSCAFLYENEIHDLFGVKFTDIAIDYKGKLYRLKQQTPFAPVQPAAESPLVDMTGKKEG